MSTNASTNAAFTENALKILLVEDDTRLSALIQEYLQKQAMLVSIEHRGDLA